MNSYSKRWAYVILKHSFAAGQSSSRTSNTHTDWMFDQGDHLWTWASDALLPAPDLPFSDRPFQKLPDHRSAYLELEGPVSGNRGYVTRIEQGQYELLVQTADRFEVQLSGGRNGILILQRTLELPDAPGSDWKGDFRPTRVDAN